MASLRQTIHEAAVIAELRAAAALVAPRPRVQLPRDQKGQIACLRRLLAAERRRSKAILEALG